ncbi:His/Gly/Thr/Pro-type tRNA ligase C-terminal domain-containing protein [Rossellomorea sp. H39__3]
MPIQSIPCQGQDIYTGTIYELFLKDDGLRSSIGSGGRYNNAIAGLKGEEEGSYSTVGISFGLDVILTALLEKEETTPEPWVDYLIIPVQEMEESFRMARVLRQEGNRVEVDMSGRSVRKSMDYADKAGIRFVAVIGEREVSNRLCMVKDMKTGKQTEWVFK